MITRRRFVSTALLGTTALVAMPYVNRAQAADFVFKWGCGLPSSHPGIIRGKEAAAKVTEESEGRLEVQLYPDNQLGGDSEMLSQVRSGGIQMYTPGATTIAPLVPVVGIINMAFAFKDGAAGFEALDGELGTYVRKAISDAKLHVFETIWGQGFREITTAKAPVNTPADLEGVKMRVPTSPLLLSLFKALGASPTSMNVSELYTALQTGLVEGQENPLSIIYTRHFYEVQKYVALSNHVWDVNIQVANLDAWNSLPDDLKQILENAMTEAGLNERKDVDELNAGLRSNLEEEGMVFNIPDVAAFRSKLKDAGFYDDWKKTYGDEAWGLLEKYTGPLA